MGSQTHRRAEPPPGRAAAAAPDASSPVAELTDMVRRTRVYEAGARAAGDLPTALRALKEGRATVELLARLRPPAVEPAVKGEFTAVWGDDREQQALRERAERAEAEAAELRERLKPPGSGALGDGPPALGVGGSADPAPEASPAPPDAGGAANIRVGRGTAERE